ALQDAVNYAWNHGVVVVAAAGNDGATTPNYPAGDAKVVGVGATDQNDQLWSDSNQSNAVFLTAPGVDIKTDSVGGGTDSVAGTSMSAAIVAGAAAQLVAVDPYAAPGPVVGRLARNAVPAGGIGNGRVNLSRSIADASIDEVVPTGAPGGGPLVGPYRAASNATFSGTVKASGTGTPIAGATVSCSGCNVNYIGGGTSTNATGQYTATASYSGAGPETFTPTASASGFTPASGPTVTCSGNGNGTCSPTSSDITLSPVANNADLSITKNDGVTSVNSGTSTTYTVRVTNNGPSSVTGAILKDASPAGLTKTAVVCSATPGQCSVGTTPTITQLESAGGFALPTLA